MSNKKTNTQETSKNGNTNSKKEVTETEDTFDPNNFYKTSEQNSEESKFFLKVKKSEQTIEYNSTKYVKNEFKKSTK